MSESWGQADLLVADVDCTAKGEGLCNRFSIKSYPTIKFGDPDFLDDLEGDRSLSTLRELRDGLAGRCGAANSSACSIAERDQLEGLFALPQEQLDQRVAERRAALKDIDTTSIESLTFLQGQYRRSLEDGRARQKEIKDTGLSAMKAVLAHRTKVPRCSPASLNTCEAEARSSMERFMAMSQDQLDLEVDSKEQEIRSLDDGLVPLLESLKAQYRAAEQEAISKKEAIKDEGLRAMRAVLAQRQRAAGRVGM